MTDTAPPPKRPSLNSSAAFLATGFGAGLLPKAPGTWGSLVALPFIAMCHSCGGVLGSAVMLLIVTGLGLWSTAAVLKGSNADPGYIVIDEIAGQWATLLFVPVDPILYALGFLFFRIADIAKPWPVCLADRAVKGALGVMLDDLLAAVYAGATLYVIADVWSL